MTTIEALLADLEADAPVRQVLVGAFWTAIHPAAGWLPSWLCLLEIPVKDELVRGVREAVAKLDTDLEVDVDLAEMSQH